MKKTMSAKTVLETLLEEWNEQAYVRSYREATNDYGAAEANEAMHAIDTVMLRLGFQEGLSYTSAKKYEKRGFTYWERTAL